MLRKGARNREHDGECYCLACTCCTGNERNVQMLRAVMRHDRHGSLVNRAPGARCSVAGLRHTFQIIRCRLVPNCRSQDLNVRVDRPDFD